MKPIRLIQAMIFLLSIFKVFALFTSAYAQVPETAFNLYIPATIKAGEAAPPPPTNGSLPAELVATWYTGNLPLTDFYDPSTGEWRAQNGLGETYTFSANGDYTYAGFLRLQNGQCYTEVSSYREGKAKAAGEELTLTPAYAKTRTLVRCGSNSDTTTDGPFDALTLGYDVTDGANGHIQFTVSDKGNSTTFYRDGMVASLVGAWQRGDVISTHFYDPTTKSFAPQSGEGGWYRFDADGTYSFGEFGYGTNDQGCALTAWVYLEGTVSISGGRLTTTPTSGALRVDNACDPGAPTVQPYVEPARSYTWFYRDRDTEPKLVIIPLEMFQEFIYQPE